MAARRKKDFLGELEQMMLLAILQLGEGAHAPDIARVLEESAGRSVSRGALYTTLNRLEKKGLVRWNIAGISSSDSTRRGYPKRRFELTESGLDALRTTRRALTNLAEGLDGVLTGQGR
jgi:DNA-binding PadR family transcriptional regulator